MADDRPVDEPGMPAGQPAAMPAPDWVLHPQPHTVPPLRDQPAMRPWGFWATLGLSSVVLLGYLGAEWVAAGLVSIQIAVPGVDVDRTDYIRLGLALEPLFAVPVGLWLILLFTSLRKRRWPMRDYLAVRKPDRSSLKLWLGVLGGYVAADILLEHFCHCPIMPQDWVQSFGWTPLLPLMFLNMAVLAPVFEEFLFRGFMLEGISRSRAGPVLGVLITSAVWAVVHSQYGWLGVTLVFFIGLVLGVARLRSGSIWLCILLHGLNNAIAGIAFVLKANGSL